MMPGRWSRDNIRMTPTVSPEAWVLTNLTPLLQFRRTGARAFRTAVGAPDQLVLTILPQSATPLAQP